MRKQMALQLTRRSELQALWDRLPEQSREELIKLYAKLIAQAAQAETRLETAGEKE